MSNINFNELSKIISHALRHQPSLYNLKLDKDGWVDVGLLIASLKNRDEKYIDLSIEDIEKMIELSQKKRHEITGNKIRASYGHSLKDKIVKENSIPPQYLYHATKNSMLENILSKGLLPMKRQYVHLSENKKDAFNVALRKTSKPIILKVQSRLASQQGLNFYKEKDSLWLSDNIDSKYLEIDNN